MIILVTNDDGINSAGLKVLANSMSEIGEVFIVAPDRQRSAVGLSVTLDQPLRVENLGNKKYSVSGMPADCIELALHKLMQTPPDIIASGINHGQNIGYDIYHSGTVGAAIVGTMFGIPSIAVSISDSSYKVYYETAGKIATKVVQAVVEKGLPKGTLLNVNVPNLPYSKIKGIEVTKHCNATYNIEIQDRKDPRGKDYYWVGGVFQLCGDHSKTDLEAISNGRVSVTPLHLDLTDYDMMKKMSDWFL
ncbi:MAG: 5'/3'-nucleotidase SurE [Candidatus Poribacteria bacterium]